jgi:hypothetical protein
MGAASNHTAFALIWLRQIPSRAMEMTASCNFVAVEVLAQEKNDTSSFCFELSKTYSFIVTSL